MFLTQFCLEIRKQDSEDQASGKLLMLMKSFCFCFFFQKFKWEVTESLEVKKANKWQPDLQIAPWVVKSTAAAQNNF